VQLVGDPDRLYALASRIAADAEAVRASAQTLGRHAAEVPWKSSGADAFRDRVDSNVRALLGSATALDDAARALRLHADTVRNRVKFLSDVAERAVQIGEGVVEDAEGVVHRLVDGPWW
jgi:hypothetical protein